MIALAWPLAVIVVAVLAARVADKALTLRADLKIVKDTAAAVLKHEARLNSLERAVDAVANERIA